VKGTKESLAICDDRRVGSRDIYYNIILSMKRGKQSKTVSLAIYIYIFFVALAPSCMIERERSYWTTWNNMCLSIIGNVRGSGSTKANRRSGKIFED